MKMLRLMAHKLNEYLLDINIFKGQLSKCQGCPKMVHIV